MCFKLLETEHSTLKLSPKHQDCFSGLELVVSSDFAGSAGFFTGHSVTGEFLGETLALCPFIAKGTVHGC